VPKDQQVAGAFMPRESSLSGAFRNPGALLRKPKADENAKEGAPTEAETYSAPIKTQVIGTPEDAQLKAARDYIQKAPSSTTGRG
jgi:hypothetical protein